MPLLYLTQICVVGKMSMRDGTCTDLVLISAFQKPMFHSCRYDKNKKMLPRCLSLKKSLTQPDTDADTIFAMRTAKWDIKGGSIRHRLVAPLELLCVLWSESLEQVGPLHFIGKPAEDVGRP